jgi:hypothetical protein
MLSSVAKDLYPEVKNCYCMVSQESEPLKKFVESLHFKEVPAESCPIAPNKQFIKGLSYWMFVKKLNS